VRALVVLLLLFGRVAAADVGDLIKGAPACDPARTCLGIALHVAVSDASANARPVATADFLATQLVHANKQFERLGVGFQYVSVAELPASAMRVEDATERTSFGPRVKGTVIHVFVTGQLDDIDVADQVIRGVAWRKDKTTKYIILSTIAQQNVLAHELGHVFGLKHSTYAVSIMNKTERAEPPYEKRTFADEEYTLMQPKLAAMLKSKAWLSIKAGR
jgi:hypothetical protein